MKIENRYRYLIKKPTQEKINELACSVAKEEGMRSKVIFTLIRWPSWVSPPSWDLLEPYYHLVVEFREKARAQLMKEYDEQPRVRIKRYKRPKRPDRKRYWTRKPTKHGHHPPPRRQGYIPLAVEREERQEAVHIEECSTKRPSRRDWRELLFETHGEPKTAGMKGSPPKTLFDNRIEFTSAVPLAWRTATAHRVALLTDPSRGAAILLRSFEHFLCVLPPAKHEELSLTA